MKRSAKRKLCVFLAMLIMLSLASVACASNAEQTKRSAPAEAAQDSGKVFASQTGGFADVPEDAWYAEAVAYLSGRGIIEGDGTGFSPGETFDRAQLAALMYKISGSPAVSGEDSFTDTAPDAWYASAVLWAERSGIVNGIGGGLFAPDDPVTQEQLVTMLYRMEGEPKAERDTEASDYAEYSVGWAREKGIAPEMKEYTFSPKEPATRAHMAEMLYRYLTLGAKQEIILTVAGQTLEVEWAENSSVEALRELLKKGDITLDMSDYGGFEKGAPLPETLVQNNEQMNAGAGDIILYQGRQFVIYYGTNSWSLTPLGKVKGMTGEQLRALLGAGSVTAVLSLGAPEKAAEPRILVAYFSATGNTRPLAGYAAELLGADIYEITAQMPYTEADLRYYTDCRADREQSDPDARPAIAAPLPDMSRYDTVVIGHPIWHGQAPKIIYTFLESFDTAGKRLVTFCTSHSSGLGSSAENLKKLTPGASWLESRRFPAGASKEDIKNWLDSIGLEKETPADAGRFNFDTKTVLLNSGFTMPIMGLGTYSLDHDTCVNSVMTLLANGGRLIDTAYMYGNEEAVGEGVRRAMKEYGISREEIFVITKIYPSQFGEPEAAIDMALQKLDIGYIDMMLLHHPGTNDVKAYKAMEKYVGQGKIRSLGLSNWYVNELNDFLPQVTITPALVQNEIHPFYQEQDVVPFIQEKGIVVQCWYPLGGRGYTAQLLGDGTIKAIADAHGVSAAQVILRWDLQRGIVVIPGSGNPEHIKENLDLFGFALTDAEMDRINALDRGEKHDWY